MRRSLRPRLAMLAVVLAPLPACTGGGGSSPDEQRQLNEAAAALDANAASTNGQQ